MCCSKERLETVHGFCLCSKVPSCSCSQNRNFEAFAGLHAGSTRFLELAPWQCYGFSFFLFLSLSFHRLVRILVFCLLWIVLSVLLLLFFFFFFYFFYFLWWYECSWCMLFICLNYSLLGIFLLLEFIWSWKEEVFVFFRYLRLWIVF